MEIKYTPEQIEQMLKYDLVSILRESKAKLTQMEEQISKEGDNRVLTEQYDIEYQKYLKLFSSVTGTISTKEH